MSKLRRLKVEMMDGEFENPIKGIAREPAQIFSIFKDIKSMAKETAIGVYLNENLEMNSYEIHSVGGADSSMIMPDEIFRSAILTNSKCFILIHNHPNGSANPSEPDRQVIRMLKAQAEVMQRNFLDFIIVGNDEYWSMHKEERGEKYKPPLSY